MLPSLVTFSHFQYATLEMLKEALNNYPIINLRFLINTHTFAIYCKNASRLYYATNQDTKPHILSYNCPKIGVDLCLSFLVAITSFVMQPFFPLKGKLQDIIIHFPYEISNDIKCRRILPLLLLISTDITRCYWTNDT